MLVPSVGLTKDEFSENHIFDAEADDRLSVHARGLAGAKTECQSRCLRRFEARRHAKIEV